MTKNMNAYVSAGRVNKELLMIGCQCCVYSLLFCPQEEEEEEKRKKSINAALTSQVTA